jgi:hypothetical protein
MNNKLLKRRVLRNMTLWKKDLGMRKTTRLASNTTRRKMTNMRLRNKRQRAATLPIFIAEIQISILNFKKEDL